MRDKFPTAGSVPAPAAETEGVEGGLLGGVGGGPFGGAGVLGGLMVGRLDSRKRWSSSRLTCKRGANLNWPGLRLFVVASIADSGGLQQTIAQVLELRTLWCLALDKQTVATKDLP